MRTLPRASQSPKIANNALTQTVTLRKPRSVKRKFLPDLELLELQECPW